jgi:hypothetical protein
MNKKNELIELITKLEPVEFIGLARVLCVDIINEEDKTTRDFYDVLNDIVNKFNTLARKQRREILSVLRRVKKENVIGTKN